MLSNSEGSYNTAGVRSQQNWRNYSARRGGEIGIESGTCRARRARLVRTRTEGLQLTLDLSQRAGQLLTSCGVRRGLKLTAEFRIGQPE